MDAEDAAGEAASRLRPAAAVWHGFGGAVALIVSGLRQQSPEDQSAPAGFINPDGLEGCPIEGSHGAVHAAPYFLESLANFNRIC